LDPELRTTAPTQATGAVEFVLLGQISLDTTFRLREPGDVSDLAAAIGRLGQLDPVELRPLPGAADSGPRWQVIAGFRRLEALRMLQREKALARVHQRLPDEDAWALALSQALLTEPLSVDQLEAVRQVLTSSANAAWALELVDDARARAPVAVELRERLLELLRQQRDEVQVDAEAAQPAEAEEIEVTPEELAEELLDRFASLNQDLALAFEVWDELPEEARRQLLEQARYVAGLFPFLERKTP
jgi:hypothetical protein